MYCRDCGKKLQDGAMFCGRCGKTIRKKTQEQEIEVLVVQIQKGDKAAFDELYLQTQQYIRYYASQFFGTNREQIEDAVQEVYVSIYKNINSLKEPKKAWGWIKTITRNTSLNMLQRNGKESLLGVQEEYVLEDAQVTDSFAIPERALEQKETKELLQAMIKELPEKQQTVLFEHYYNNMKISEISDAYGMLEGTVKCMLSRARKVMEEKICTYQKEAGVSLYSVSAAPLFYLLFKEQIQTTVKTAGVPRGIMTLVKGSGISQAAAAGVQAAGAVGKTTMGSIGKNVAAETVKTLGRNYLTGKVVMGITAVTLAGTAVVQVVRNGDSDQKKIKYVIEAFEEACRELDQEAAINCLSKESKQVLCYADLMGEYTNEGRTGSCIREKTDLDLQLSQIKIEGDQASAVCTYIDPQDDGQEKIQRGYLSFVYEDEAWKIDLCRSSKQMYERATHGSNMRFPELIQNELIYNDELDE